MDKCPDGTGFDGTVGCCGECMPCPVPEPCPAGWDSSTYPDDNGCKVMMCHEPEPTVVGEGESCNYSVHPMYQTHCEEGLECKQADLTVVGASGICTKPTKPCPVPKPCPAGVDSSTYPDENGCKVVIC